MDDPGDASEDRRPGRFGANPSVISDTGNAWAALVREGGLSATAVFQALLSSRVAQAISEHAPDTALINCGFPDVVNAMIMALGHKVLCGTGNVAILSNVFAGRQGHNRSRAAEGSGPLSERRGRRPNTERQGARAPRVFVDGREIGDVFAEFDW
ncbi:MAG: hypothetical protein R3D43_10280 [Tepidamorphaceae bacterium]